ncbi:MAG: PhzF family phenazine biosynthesis protein [Hyphomicrobiales bacterium]|nr:PhzF family phenazine biosynthesis protein [Hyphomicrobiales bacterium]
MQLVYHTVDVFTRTRFGGNPLAVVLGADGLTREQMQAVAREFNYSETSFVLRPIDRRYTACLRIFTPTMEVPFAGHPSLGTAFVLAKASEASKFEEFTFEEQAGLVHVRIIRKDGRVDEINLAAPQSLTIGGTFDPEEVAPCLSLSPSDICLSFHQPCIASVGLPFLVVEVATRAALARATAREAHFARILPSGGADAIYLYCRELSEQDGNVDFSARMFAPFDGLPEDPATGSATAAACALIAALDSRPPYHFRIAQGIDMGRPSLLTVEIEETGTVLIGGSCVSVMTGTLDLQ